MEFERLETPERAFTKTLEKNRNAVQKLIFSCKKIIGMSAFEYLPNPRFSEPVIRIFEDPNIIIGGTPIIDIYNKLNDALEKLRNWRRNVKIMPDIKSDVESLIKALFDELRSVLNDFTFLANQLIEKSKLLVEDLINDIFKNLTDLVSNIWGKINDLLKQAEILGQRLISKISDLNDKIFENLDEFRQALFDDLHSLIDHAVVAGQVITTGTFEQLISEFRRAALTIQDFLDGIDIFDPDARKRKEISEKIKEHLSIGIKPIWQWGHIQTYDYLCCYTLLVEDYEIETKQGTERIGNIETLYAELQDKAWRLSTLGLEDSKLSKEAMEDWVKYGQLYELWHKLGDEDMGLLDAINDKLKELDQARDEFNERSAQIESLREELQNRSAQIDSLKDGLANGKIADGLHKHSTLTGNGSTESTLSIGSSNFTLDKSEASPNAGYVRFGDNTGWKLHIGRSQESVGSSFNKGTTGVLMTIQDNGTVGINTADPRERLDVLGDVIIFGNLGTHNLPPKPLSSGWAGGIHTYDIEAEGTIWSGHGYRNESGDLAENYISEMDLEPGDVVCLDKDTDGIVISEKPNNPFVLGVVSTEPGFLLNAERDEKETKVFPVSLCGRVPCKVVDENGPIRRGDLLTSSSTPGHAMKANPANDEKLFCFGTIIGKAISEFESGKGVIDIFVFSS